MDENDPPLYPVLAVEVVLLKLLPRNGWISFGLARDYMQAEIRTAIQQGLVKQNHKAHPDYYREARENTHGSLGVAIEWLRARGVVSTRCVGGEDEWAAWEVTVTGDDAVERLLGLISGDSRKLYHAYTPSLLIRLAGA